MSNQSPVRSCRLEPPVQTATPSVVTFHFRWMLLWCKQILEGRPAVKLWRSVKTSQTNRCLHLRMTNTFLFSFLYDSRIFFRVLCGRFSSVFSVCSRDDGEGDRRAWRRKRVRTRSVVDGWQGETPVRAYTPSPTPLPLLAGVVQREEEGPAGRFIFTFIRKYLKTAFIFTVGADRRRVCVCVCARTIK